MLSCTVDTRIVTLIGKPLSQSFSVRMQNAAYEAAGFNMFYFNSEIEKEELAPVVQAMRYLPSAGFAVTKPYKVAVMELLDELDPLAEKIGACNTVVVKDGRLIGHNTDGSGFYRSLVEESGLDTTQSTFFCCGAGGAGRAMACVLADQGAKKIYISDVYAPAAEELTKAINELFAPVAEYVPFDDAQAYAAAISDSDVVMNASGIGMAPHLNETPIPKEALRPGQICFDACYNPNKTLFLEEAEQIGCKIINGLGMCLYQGVAQIELWTGKTAPVEAMRQELLDILKEKGVK